MSQIIRKIYKITNLVNDKIYIGQTKQKLERRFQQHTETNYPIGRAMRKHGRDKFKIETLLISDDLEYINMMEQKIIEAYDCIAPNGYNLASGGLHFEHSEVTKRKLSEIAKAKGVNPELTKLAAEVNTGNPRSEEVKKKISEAQKGKTLSESHLKNLRAAMKNRKPRNDIKKVHCITLGLIFDSAKEAGRLLDIVPNTIRLVCCGSRKKTPCGLVFQYYEG